jgi:hypothetical protein
MTRHYSKRFDNVKPKKRQVVQEVTFTRSRDDIWLELECGHFIRKGAHKQWGGGFLCDACIGMGALT